MRQRFANIRLLQAGSPARVVPRFMRVREEWVHHGQFEYNKRKQRQAVRRANPKQRLAEAPTTVREQRDHDGGSDQHDRG